eukprot:TRINITY_DN3868_c1_g1_i1.p2 TRINITY_DN3868_c1_g1~~TRINITY_DN3868_c1_g1_i1.p2  ORF type:complete len:278 (-),score=-19.84 TRINITY_DN3868_c1_g1_i1:821-1654(-)
MSKEKRYLIITDIKISTTTHLLLVTTNSIKTTINTIFFSKNYLQNQQKCLYQVCKGLLSLYRQQLYKGRQILVTVINVQLYSYSYIILRSFSKKKETGMFVQQQPVYIYMYYFDQQNLHGIYKATGITRNVGRQIQLHTQLQTKKYIHTRTSLFKQYSSLLYTALSQLLRQYQLSDAQICIQHKLNKHQIQMFLITQDKCSYSQQKNPIQRQNSQQLYKVIQIATILTYTNNFVQLYLVLYALFLSYHMQIHIVNIAIAIITFLLDFCNDRIELNFY